MSLLTRLSFILILGIYGSAQVPVAPALVQEPYDQHVVQRQLSANCTFSTGWDDKHVPRLGDRAGIAMLKINAGEVPDSAVLCVLRILEFAFAYPHAIKYESDRKAAVTVLLLDKLHQRTSDKKLRVMIAETRTMLQSAHLSFPLPRK